MDKEVRKQRLLKLKQEAEESLLSNEDSVTPTNFSDKEKLQDLIHNLQVYQIELEMQNDELFKTQQLLSNARDEYQSLYDYAPMGYCTLDKRGLITRVNNTLLNILNCNGEVVIGSHLIDFLDQPSAYEFRSRFRAFFNKPEGKELNVKLAYGTKAYVLITGSAGRETSEHNSGHKNLLVSLTDVTKSKEAEFELNLAEQVFQHSIEGIAVTDPLGTVIRINKAFTVVTGYREAEILGQNMSILQSGAHNPEFYQVMWDQIKSNRSWQGEITNKRKNGDQFIEWLTISSITDHQGDITHYVAIFSDITEKKMNTLQMQQLAYYDVLTGLPNRTLFFDRLKQGIIQAKRSKRHVALLFLDLDNFKEINDQFGHAAGDALLQQASKRLNSVVRKGDTVSRLGGDEFTIIVPDIKDTVDYELHAASIAEKIINDISRPYTIADQQHSISVSIGISIFPNDGTGIADLLKHADTAMYQAKASGKNGYHFFSQQKFDALQEITQLKKDLIYAAERDELVLNFQPQIELSTGKVRGAEALVRWNHPSKGLLLPGNFIPLSEENGSIIDIGYWVIDKALSSHRELLLSGHNDFIIAVNISIEQLRDENFINQLRRYISIYNTPTELLELEVTESVMLQDTLEVSGILKEIRRLGVKISLDDFGTGYSTMKYIKHFPLDCIKIDKSFVDDIFTSHEDKSIVLASISLSKNLNLHTVAEGIENKEQQRFLEESGCDFGQGYLFSKPLKYSDFDSFLINN